MTEDPILRLETDANVLAAIKAIRARGERDANLLALCDSAERAIAWEAKHGRRPQTLDEMVDEIRSGYPRDINAIDREMRQRYGKWEYAWLMRPWFPLSIGLVSGGALFAAGMWFAWYFR